MVWVMEVKVECPACKGKGDLMHDKVTARWGTVPAGRCQVCNGEGRRWRMVRPSGGEVYTYGDKQVAERMLRMCYPLEVDVRVREVTEAEAATGGGP